MEKELVEGYIPDSVRKCLIAQYPDRLRQLDAKMRTKEEYEATLKRIEELFDAKPDTPECEELDRLADAVVEYEGRLYPFPPLKES
jgi:hypothetical protein